jgi:hypothetical protein
MIEIPQANWGGGNFLVAVRQDSWADMDETPQALGGTQDCLIS